MQRDTLVFDIIRKELERQRHGIELIASENFTSLQVIQAAGSVMTNKYARATQAEGITRVANLLTKQNN